MRKILLVPAIAAVAAIAACSGGSVALQPGQWEMVTKVTDAEVPGAPPAMAAQMKQAIASTPPQTQSRCISPAEAANPVAGLANPSGNAAGCTFGKQTFAGGRIDIAATCPSPTGGTMQTTFAGTYTATTMNINFSANIQGGSQQVRTSGLLTARRTGDCTSSPPAQNAAQ